MRSALGSQAKGKAGECELLTQTTTMSPHGILSIRGIAGLTFKTTNVSSFSLPRRVTFQKDDLDNICKSACHLYHEIQKLEPRKFPGKLFHTHSRMS